VAVPCGFWALDCGLWALEAVCGRKRGRGKMCFDKSIENLWQIDRNENYFENKKISKHFPNLGVAVLGCLWALEWGVAKSFLQVELIWQIDRLFWQIDLIMQIDRNLVNLRCVWQIYRNLQDFLNYEIISKNV